jgi:hypothetical protein
VRPVCFSGAANSPADPERAVRRNRSPEKIRAVLPFRHPTRALSAAFANFVFAAFRTPFGAIARPPRAHVELSAQNTDRDFSRQNATFFSVSVFRPGIDSAEHAQAATTRRARTGFATRTFFCKVVDIVKSRD